MYIYEKRTIHIFHNFFHSRLFASNTNILSSFKLIKKWPLLIINYYIQYTKKINLKFVHRNNNWFDI